MAWGWTRCPVPLTVRGTQALVPLTVRGSDAKLIAARRRLAEIYDREDHECDVEAGVPVAVATIVNAPVAAEEGVYIAGFVHKFFNALQSVGDDRAKELGEHSNYDQKCVVIP